MNIRPLYDRIVVRRLEEDSQSAGGIVIPDTAKEKPSRGEVMAIGTGKVLDKGEVRPLGVNVGEQILFDKFAGTDVTLSGEDFVVMREDDIMGVIEQ